MLMCQMLLSINPQHVENILCGKKKYEFRKVKCRSAVDTILIYATSPIMKIVAEAEVLEVLEDNPEKIWHTTSGYAGISKQFYDSYYKGKKRAVAYRLGEVKKYKYPKSLSDYGIKTAPQSFVYV